MVGRRHTVSHPRRRTGGVQANPDHRNHRHCFLPIQNPFQQQQQHHQLQQRHSSNPGSPSSTSAMTAMTDSTLTMIEPSCSGGGGSTVPGPSTQTSLTVNSNVVAPGVGFITRDNSLRLKPCLSLRQATTGHKAASSPGVGLEMVTMRTPQRKGSFQVVLLKKDSVRSRSRSSFVSEL